MDHAVVSGQRGLGRGRAGDRDSSSPGCGVGAPLGRGGCQPLYTLVGGRSGEGAVPGRGVSGGTEQPHQVWVWQQREPEGPPGTSSPGIKTQAGPGKRAGVVWPGLQRDGLGGDPICLPSGSGIGCGQARLSRMTYPSELKLPLDRGYQPLDWSRTCLRFEELLGKLALLEAHHVPG